MNNILSSNKGNKTEKINNKEQKIISNDKKNGNEYFSLIKYKDKIIGCNRENIKKLIKEKEYQIIENEINVLVKEKQKLENEILKMPERPKKLNDIRNKKEMNDTINKMEKDIDFIHTLLKNTDDYYIH